MKKRSAFLTLAFLLVMLLLGHSEEASVPSMIDLGFNDFRASGYEKAFSTWAYGSPLSQNALWNRRVTTSAALWSSLGTFRTYSEVRSLPLSTHSTVITLAAQFDRGEVFFRFIVYRADGLSLITSVTWASDPAQLASY